MKIINIMVGGPASEIPSTGILKQQPGLWIGVDYGATYLLNEGIVPNLALGDFDSTDEQELHRLKEKVARVKVFAHKTEHTDTQLGVLAAMQDYEAEQINIFGATGGRLDQLLANLSMPAQPDYRPAAGRLVFIDRHNVMTFYEPGTYAIRRIPRMRYLAFVNLGPVRGLTLPDEKFHLDNFSADVPYCWSSNEFCGDVNHFSFTDGMVAVIQSIDEQHGNA